MNSQSDPPDPHGNPDRPKLPPAPFLAGSDDEPAKPRPVSRPSPPFVAGAQGAPARTPSEPADGTPANAPSQPIKQNPGPRHDEWAAASGEKAGENEGLGDEDPRETDSAPVTPAPRHSDWSAPPSKYGDEVPQNEDWASPSQNVDDVMSAASDDAAEGFTFTNGDASRIEDELAHGEETGEAEGHVGSFQDDVFDLGPAPAEELAVRDDLSEGWLLNRIPVASDAEVTDDIGLMGVDGHLGGTSSTPAEEGPDSEGGLGDTAGFDREVAESDRVSAADAANSHDATPEMSGEDAPVSPRVSEDDSVRQPSAVDIESVASRLEKIAKSLRDHGLGGPMSDQATDPLGALITGYVLGFADRTPRRRAEDPG